MMDHSIKRFTVYRPNVSVVFSDGTCVLRWRTAINSCSVWDSFEDAMKIHGHPEYGTKVVFHDGELPLPWQSQQ